MPYALWKNVGKALISVQDLRQLENQRRHNKRDFWEGTTHKRGILSRFSDKQPNRSHLVTLVWGPKN